MKLSENTVLITGGASGIGWGMATRFVKAGSQVIVCGRRQDQLALAKKECPQLHTVVADVSTPTGREALFKKVSTEFPALNVLINNAGIQVRPKVDWPPDWQELERELMINLHAPMHLSQLFIPHLKKQKLPAIVNVTSGLAFSPLAFMAGYSATKAGLHSYTLSLRHLLKDTSIKVIEIAPPAVNTDLGGKGLHNFGVPLAEFSEHVMKHLAQGDLEFGHSFSEKARLASRQELDLIFSQMNSRPDNT